MSGSSIYKRVSLILSNILLLFSAFMVHCIDFPTYYHREVPAQPAQKDQLVQMVFVELFPRILWIRFFIGSVIGFEIEYHKTKTCNTVCDK